MQLQFKLVAALLLCGFASVTPLVVADEPTTKPSTMSVSDEVEVKAIRDTLVAWDKSAGKDSLQDIRKQIYTTDEREAMVADHDASDSWESGKTQQAIRDKWGPASEETFSHAVGSTTREDDQQVQVAVDKNHAVISWKIPGTDEAPLIKIDGKWLIDGHATFTKYLKLDENFDKLPRRPIASLMRQAAVDITSDKFDDFESFLAEYKPKFDALLHGN